MKLRSRHGRALASLPQALDAHGVDHDYYIGGNGGHDWGTWRDHLHYMLPKLWRAK